MWRKIGTKNELETKVKNIFRLIYPVGKHFLKRDEKSLKHFQLFSFEVEVLVRICHHFYVNHRGFLTFILW